MRKPARVSIIRDGVKYKAGCAPVRVCPAPSRAVRQAVRQVPVSHLQRRVIPVTSILSTPQELRRAGGEIGSAHSDPRTRALLADGLAALAEKALRFKRPKGSKNAATPAIQQHVKNLVKKNPNATVRQLYLRARRDIIDKPSGAMSFDTFKRYVTEAHRALGTTSRRGRARK
jgi:hypothetical protein